MTIAVSPLTPTPLDRNEDRRNPREPRLDKDGKPLEPLPESRDKRLDDLEDAVPPLAPNK